jgi:Tol biopolymer transport system component
MMRRLCHQCGLRTLGIGLIAGAVACTTGDANSGSASATSNTRTTINLMVDSMSQYMLSAGPNGRVAYGRVHEGTLNIYVADSSGANPRRLSKGVWDGVPKWSPDGKWIAFGREVNGNDVVIVPVDSGPERAIASTTAVEVPIGWLPDNSGVLFTRVGDRDELWVAPLEGSPRRLVESRGSVGGTVSPDGRWLAYDVLLDGKRTLRVRDLTTGADTALTTEGYESLSRETGNWSPDGTRVLYESRRSGTLDVWSVHVVTGERRQITRDVRDDFLPKYSPDGRRVAFISDRGGQRDVWIVADTGGEATRVSDDKAREAYLEWTRDGGSLLISGTDAESHIYRVGLDGAPPVRVLNETFQDLDPRIAADGSRMVFTAIENSDADVRTALLADGRSTLVAGGPSDDFQPDLSPDGQRVVFASNRSGNNDLWVAPVSGGTATRLIDWPSSETWPRWSADGQWIAFVSTRAASAGLWLVKADGTGARQVATSVPVDPIRWSHRGALLGYTETVASGESSVRVLDVATGRVYRVTDGGAYAGWAMWPGDSLMSVAKYEDGMSRLELRRIRDGALVQPLSPTTGLAYEGFGVPSPDQQWVALSQYTFKNNDYPLAVRRRDGSNTRVLSTLRGNTSSVWWRPDGTGLVFTNAGDAPRMYRVVVPASGPASVP